MRKLLFSIAIAGAFTAGVACGGESKSKSKPAGGSAATGSGSATTGSATTGSGSATPTPPTPAPPPPAPPAPKDDGLAELGTGADGRSLYYPRALTDADLAGRTLRDLALMRNTVYARAGHAFRKAWLRDHFTAQAWYAPLAQDDASKITAVDRANVKLIAAREVAVPRDELVARRAALQATPSPGAAEQIELRLLNEQLGGTGGQAAATKASPLEDPSQLDRLLTLDELSDLSQRDLRILRNTVYARHGREFKSDTLIQWFSDKDWYQPDPAFTDAKLTSIDRKNVRLIRSVEDSLGGPLTEQQQKADEGWFDGA